MRYFEVSYRNDGDRCTCWVKTNRDIKGDVTDFVLYHCKKKKVLSEFCVDMIGYGSGYVAETTYNDIFFMHRALNANMPNIPEI